MVDIGPEYLADLATKVDFAKIRASKIGIGYDALHGSGAGYLDRVLADQGIPAATLHVDRDVYFGGHHPEPAENRWRD
jgi:phosphoglucomutase